MFVILQQCLENEFVFVQKERKENSSHGLHLFQERLFSFFPGLPLLPVFLPSFSSVILSAAKNLSISADFISNPSDGLVKVRLLQLALPNNDYAPAFRLQLTPYFLIPLLVPENLSHPKLRVGLRDRIIFTVLVAMPETAGESALN